jgi:GTPase SAR1 family protein
MKDAKEIKGKIILLGKSEVGKTSLINRYIDGKFSAIVASTMGSLKKKKQNKMNLIIFYITK